MAAVPSVSPADAPDVTYPASAPVTSDMYLLAAPCNSDIDTDSFAASRIDSITSVGIKAPPTRVDAPETLIIGLTPNLS